MHHQIGNDSRNRAFHVRWTFQKEVLMGHGEREQMLKDSSKSFYGQIPGG
jgi:hypothetical protein